MKWLLLKWCLIKYVKFLNTDLFKKFFNQINLFLYLVKRFEGLFLKSGKSFRRPKAIACYLYKCVINRAQRC